MANAGSHHGDGRFSSSLFRADGGSQLGDDFLRCLNRRGVLIHIE
jgi:hypothetical protein